MSLLTSAYSHSEIKVEPGWKVRLLKPAQAASGKLHLSREVGRASIKGQAQLPQLYSTSFRQCSRNAFRP